MCAFFVLFTILLNVIITFTFIRLKTDARILYGSYCLLFWEIWLQLIDRNAHSPSWIINRCIQLRQLKINTPVLSTLWCPPVWYVDQLVCCDYLIYRGLKSSSHFGLWVLVPIILPQIMLFQMGGSSELQSPQHSFLNNSGSTAIYMFNYMFDVGQSDTWRFGHWSWYC